jgi:DNA-binding transcriptional ArsR family regulator
MSDDKKIAEALFDPDVSVILAELEHGPKEPDQLAQTLGISEQEIGIRLSYLIESGIVRLESAAYSVDSERIAKIMENDENYKGVVDGLTELDSYLN